MFKYVNYLDKHNNMKLESDKESLPLSFLLW